MTKILLPLLLALGLALGLYLLVRRRKIVVPENGSRLGDPRIVRSAWPKSIGLCTSHNHELQNRDEQQQDISTGDREHG